MKKKRLSSAFNDLTLNDSANAPKPVTRPRKHVMNSTKDDDGQDIPEPEDTAFPDQLVPVASGSAGVCDVASYRIILPEIWLEISKHIRPEDIGSFAAVCRTTYQITRSAPFWFQIYKKYGPKVGKYGEIADEIPMRLRPDSMVRLGELRACVIRTLFYTYRPFVSRLEHIDRNLELTSFNRRLKVLQMWHVQLKPKLFGYCFRLQAPKMGSVTGQDRVRDPLRDVLANPQEGCRILYIESTKYVPLPIQSFDSTQKKYVKSVTYNMSQGFRSYKVNLELVLYNGAHYSTLVIDPACLIKTWNWWHPTYHQLKNAGKYYIPPDPEDDFYFNFG